MGRSVSTPTTTELVAFSEWFQPDPEWIEEERAAIGDPDWYPEPDHDEWSWFVESTADYARELWPSLTPCDEWLGREDHAVLENELAYFGVSEYCGVAAIWVASKGQYWSDTFDRVKFAETWCRRIAPRFDQAFGNLDRLGRVSDGTSVYQRREVTV